MRTRLGEAGLLSDDTRAVAVFEEAGREYRAENPKRKRILRYRVDGEMIKDGERCDYLMGLPDVECVYVIELKGADLKKAVRQVLATLSRLEDRIASCRPHARIVLSRVQRPAVRPAIVLALERRLARRGGRLRHASQVLNETV